MARFNFSRARSYDPHVIDGAYSMNVECPRCIPVICSKQIADDGYGRATVNGIEISKGRCYSFSYESKPVYLLPVGEVANEYDKEYTVRLSGYKAVDNSRFPDAEFRVKTEKARLADPRNAANERVAKDVADEGIVLLQNDGTLPLAVGTKVALRGEYNDFRISLVGAGAIKPRWSMTVEQAVSANGKLVLAQDGDCALYFLSRGSGENKDNRACEGQYYLTQSEKDEMKAAIEDHEKAVLVLNTGYPVEMGYILDAGFSAIIWTSFPGQRGSESLADILTGAVNPSGRLADTWPLDYYDTPSSKNFINLGKEEPLYDDNGAQFAARVFYEEGLYVGYRYFDTFDKKAAFCFGHGMSYTRFEQTAEVSFDDGALSVEICVTNTGKMAGKQVAQIYVQPPQDGIDKPKRAFAGFAKTRLLDPDDSECLSVEIPAKDFAIYDEGAFILEPGKYIVWAGESLERSQQIGSFTVGEKTVVQKTKRVNLPPEEVAELRRGGEVAQRSSIVSPKEYITERIVTHPVRAAELKRYKGKKIMLSDVKRSPEKLEDFVSQFSVKQLVALSICNGSDWGKGKTGAAGRLRALKKFGVPELVMSDGNCGVNLYRFTTGFPSSNLLCCTFNKELALAVGKVIADESKENGVAINLGPGGNLHRNLLCGRNVEYFSEDPIMAGTMMAYQAMGTENNGVHATYKHFFANNMEFERKAAHSIIPERALRELYLRVFDKALSLHQVSCIMTSYNPVNGLYPTENSELLQDILREELGFDGFYMTDWTAYETIDTVKAVLAGTSLITPGSKEYCKLLMKAVKDKQLSKAILQDNVKWIIKMYIKQI